MTLPLPVKLIGGPLDGRESSIEGADKATGLHYTITKGSNPQKFDVYYTFIGYNYSGIIRLYMYSGEVMPPGMNYK